MVLRTHATIENWLGGQIPRLADMLDRTPDMANVFRDLTEGIQRFLQTRGLQPEDLSPTIVITPDGKLVIDLLSESWSQQPH